MAWLHKQPRHNPDTNTREPYWSIGWREKGAQRTMAVGFVPLTEARRLLTIFEGKLAAGRVPPRKRTGPGSRKGRRTLADYLDDVFLPMRRLLVSPATAAANINSSKALKASMGTQALDQTDFAVAHNHLISRLEAGRSAGTVQQELYVLRLALQHACDTGVIRCMPKLPTLDYEPDEQDFLDGDEEQALLKSMYELGGWGYLVVLTALNTGMRRRELLTRGWEDIQWSDGPLGSVLVCPKPSHAFKVKGRRSRAIPMSPELRSELEQEHARLGRPNSGLIFPSPRAPDRPRANFRHPLSKGCRAAGLRVVSPHALRRTWASRLARNGMDRAALIALGGWKDGKMLDNTYARITPIHAARQMMLLGVSGRPGPKALAAK